MINQDSLTKYFLFACIILIILLTMFKNIKINYKESIFITLLIIVSKIIFDKIYNLILIIQNFEHFITNDENKNILSQSLSTNNTQIQDNNQNSNIINIQEPIQEIKPESNIQEPSQTNNNNVTISDNINTLDNTNKHDYKSDVRLASANDKQREGCRWKDGELINDLPYTDYNHLPMADEYNNQDYEYGYSFMPPSKWYPTPPFPPVCVTNRPSDVSPLLTTGSPVDVKEWNTSLRITPPDNINIDYIKDKLNSGR